MRIDFKKVFEKAKKYETDITKFLRDMIAIPSESCNEERVVLRIKEEMENEIIDLKPIRISLSDG